MNSHYYTANPSGEHELREISYDFKGRKLHFTTDANVFSKERVDFGSSLLIQTMEIGEQDRVLDVGCGYGPIGICAALLAHRGRVTMIDINQRAVELAKLNIVRNQISNAEAFVSDGLAQLSEENKFQTVLTNPPIRAGKETVFRIYEEANQHLEEGGSLWVVIQKKQGADSTEKKLKELFPHVELMNKEKGYRIYKAIKLNT